MVSSILGIVISGAQNGTVLIHQLFGGSVIRTLLDSSESKQQPVRSLQFCEISASIIVIIGMNRVLVFSINGELLCDSQVDGEISCCCVISRNTGEEVLAVGRVDGAVVLYRAYDLTLLEEIVGAKAHGKVCTLVMSHENTTLYAGTQSGHLVAFVPTKTKT